MSRQSQQSWFSLPQTLVLALACLGVAAGCNRPAVVERGTVQGQVTFAGRPVINGTIRFENAKSGVSLNADLGPDARYQVKTHEGAGLPPGTYQVAVVPRVAPAADPGQFVGVAPPDSTPSQEFPDIPLKYRDATSSGLTVTVATGENPPFDFDLSK